MPEYKKKKIKKLRKETKNTYTDEIKMAPKEKLKPAEKKQVAKPEKVKPEAPEKKKVRVIRGNKIRNKRRKITVALSALLIVAAIVITSLLLPTGIFELLQNLSASRGTGSGYEATVTGGSLINTVEMNNVFITVTPTAVSGYNSKTGKSVFSYSHGYERPLIATSEARFIIYSQGGNEYNVYNFKKELISAETENDILTAEITRDGTFAIATQSDGYSSEVAVYNKKGKEIYRWFCADYIINDIQLSDNGEKLVLSAINAQKGTYVSKLFVLEFETATPVFSKTFDNELLLNLESDNLKTFYAVFENKVEFFKWRTFENTVFDTDKNFVFNRSTEKNSLLVAGHNSNKGNNTIYVFNKKAEKISEFNVDYEILDVAFKGDCIYILSDKIIYLYSVDGEKAASGECSFGSIRVLPISHHNAIVLTDNSANKINLE